MKLVNIAILVMVCIISLKADNVLLGEEANRKGNFNSAKHFWEKACESGNFEGCYKLGNLYFTGKLGKINTLKAKELYSSACRNKNAKGCYNLANLYLELNKQSSNNSYNAIGKYIEACHLGIAMSCFNVGVLVSKKGDLLTAKNFYEKACDGGDIKGCYNLAIAYSNGKGVNKNNLKALKYFQKACDGNASFVLACKNVSKIEKYLKKEKEWLDENTHEYIGIKMLSFVSNNTLIDNKNKIIKKIAGLNGSIITDESERIVKIILEGDISTKKSNELTKRLNSKYTFIQKDTNNAIQDMKSEMLQSLKDTDDFIKEEIMSSINEEWKNIKGFNMLKKLPVTTYIYKNDSDTIHCKIRNLGNTSTVKLEYISEEFFNQIKRKKDKVEKDKQRNMQKYSKELNKF